MPPRSAFQSAPDLAGMLTFDNRRGRRHSLTMDLGSDIGDNKAIGGGYVGAIPNSFATQMAYAEHARRSGQSGNDDQQRMGKLMLARMNALEEGFRDILKEVKDWRKDETRSAGDTTPYEPTPEMKIGRTRSKKSTKRDGKLKVKVEDKADEGDSDGDFTRRHRGSSL